MNTYGGGRTSDPSTKISQIIEKRKSRSFWKKYRRNWRGAAECAEEEKDEEGNCPVGPKNSKNYTWKSEFYTHYEFPGNFTNLKESKKFLQISLGVSTQYDEQVMANVDSHQLALRSEILTIMSTFSPADIAGREGKQKLADSLKEGINNTLVKVEGFGGVENVHFTSFVLQ